MIFNSAVAASQGASQGQASDPYGFQAMNQQPPPQQGYDPHWDDEGDFVQDNSWTGKDYSDLFQGLGQFIDAGGGALQKIYLATKADNVNASIQQNSSSEVINKLITENQNLKASINQTGAVPQVYAPQTQQAAQSQIKASHVFGAIGIGAAIIGVALVLKR